MMRRTTKARVIGPGDVGEYTRIPGAGVLALRDSNPGHDESDRVPESGPHCRGIASVEIDTDRLVSVLSEAFVSRVPNAVEIAIEVARIMHTIKALNRDATESMQMRVATRIKQFKTVEAVVASADM